MTKTDAIKLTRLHNTLEQYLNSFEEDGSTKKAAIEPECEFSLIKLLELLSSKGLNVGIPQTIEEFLAHDYYLSFEMPEFIEVSQAQNISQADLSYTIVFKFNN